MAHLLVVDDEQSICWGLAQLGRQLGHTVEIASSAEQGIENARRQRPDVLLLDVRLPGIDGLSAIPHFREICGPLPIVVMTAYGELETAVEAVRKGAFEYLVKPFDLKVAQRTIERGLASRGEPEAPPPVTIPRDGERIVGKSAALQAVFNEIALVAPADACVHISGESGTGKELVARAIHRYSRRSGGPFIPINMAALSPTLAESELFGHERGAFTGADQSRPGLLAQAGGGTVFLDEVADIPLAIQVKLLRALEHGEVWPVGADRPTRTDFRLVSATHQDLRSLVADGRFRHDLYYRLMTFHILLPRLCERHDDIGELARHFASVLAEKSSMSPPVFSTELLAELDRRPWHGNVRELRNAIEYAIILARGGTLLAEHLPPPAPASANLAGDPAVAIAEQVRRWAEEQLANENDAADLYNRLLALVEPPLLRAVLDKYHGQYSAAARRLGLHRVTLRKKLDESS